MIEWIQLGRFRLKNQGHAKSATANILLQGFGGDRVNIRLSGANVDSERAKMIGELIQRTLICFGEKFSCEKSGAAIVHDLLLSREGVIITKLKIYRS